MYIWRLSVEGVEIEYTDKDTGKQGDFTCLGIGSTGKDAETSKQTLSVEAQIRIQRQARRCSMWGADKDAYKSKGTICGAGTDKEADTSKETLSMKGTDKDAEKCKKTLSFGGTDNDTEASKVDFLCWGNR